MFNLTSDDGERVDLRAEPQYADELAKWRGRMVAQFEAQNRGPLWVHNGVLQLRKPQLYNSNYPGSTKPSHPAHPADCANVTLKPRDKLDVSPSQGTTHVRVCQRVAVTEARQLAMVVDPSLCIQPVAGEQHSGLVLATCATDSNATSMQVWQVPGPDTAPAHVVHEKSHLCLASGGGGSTLALEPCSSSAQLLWVLGSGGRLCGSSSSGSNHGCVSVVP